MLRWKKEERGREREREERGTRTRQWWGSQRSSNACAHNSLRGICNRPVRDFFHRLARRWRNSGHRLEHFSKRRLGARVGLKFCSAGYHTGSQFVVEAETPIIVLYSFESPPASNRTKHNQGVDGSVEASFEAGLNEASTQPQVARNTTRAWTEALRSHLGPASATRWILLGNATETPFPKCAFREEAY